MSLFANVSQTKSTTWYKKPTEAREIQFMFCLPSPSGWLLLLLLQVAVAWPEQVRYLSYLW